MKVYFNQTNYNKNQHSYINIICKILLDDYSPERLEQAKGNSVDQFKYEPDIAKANFCMLPYYWNYYVQNEKIEEAQSEIEAAKRHGKRVVILNTGDYPANVPFKDVILFERAGYLSTPGLLYHSALPCFISDYLKVYCEGKLKPRPKLEIPTIGFCGLANTSPFISAFRKFRLELQWLNYKLGKRKWEPAPFETSLFRKKVLREFENVNGIRTNYILRKKYRGGEVRDKSFHHPVKETFVNNILDSDYTVCMRGGGNFSQRFFETLCLGRIPIFVDTDCLLPFQDELKFQSIFPWIEIDDLPNIADIVKDFHASLSSDDFVRLQKTCRQLWIKHMTKDGFFDDLISKISSLT